ncbi:unnamed protein product [Menidia menidia]|uniref:(Atlantic silverside) hypothetical protein n=1 Tax=Menidia menidia TaxID=238744 RepID=A0A8S4B158_9TELE|nr:unnamed protein product [Menidia menidia]
MSSVTGPGERFAASTRGAHGISEAHHHCGIVGFSGKTPGGDCRLKQRPSPEGAGGSRADMMYRRTDDVPSSAGDRLRSAVPFGSGTLCRGSGTPVFGRADRKVACCEKCSATLVALKKQALSLAVHHHFSCKDTSELSMFLHDNLRVHGRSNMESRERERELGQCGACGSNVNQLKQEAIHLALSRGQSVAKPPFWASLGSDTVQGQTETKHGDRVVHQPRSQSHSPHMPGSPRTPQRTPQTLRRRGPKTPNTDMDRWVEEQQHLVSSKSVSNTDRDPINSYHQAADDASLGCGESGAIQTNSKIPNISRVVTIANTAAMSFLARAAERLNLTLRKKGQASDPAPSHFSTCFREIIQKNPPPVPSCLLQAAVRTKDSPDVAKVQVMLRVSRMLSDGQGQPPVLRIDSSKKRVTVLDPISKNPTYTTMTLGRGGNKSPLKTFNFDATFSQDSSQAEVGAGVLSDVIRCVLSGSDGCVLGLGCTDVGSWSSMVGSGENIQKLGMIPCAISWLYSAIERRREKTWTDLTVSVSAIELCCGDEDTLRDLLGEVVPSSGSAQDSPKAHVRVQEDPVYGIQLRNHNRVKAPTAERAASLLDAAIAARRHADFITYLCHSSIMFFTLYVQPPRTESSTIGKGSRGTTKLTMIDVCSGMRGMIKNKPPHSELGPIVVSLLSGNKHIPSKGSKLAMLLHESMTRANCHITVLAQVADSLTHLQETFSTIQLASRIRRTQKRTKQSTSCSPSGRSLTKGKKGTQSLSLRAFHSTDEVDVDSHPFRLRGELHRSSSDQSCDTVIQIDSDGFHSKAAPVLAQPEFVPIIPSLHPNKSDLEDPEFTALLQELLRIPQLHGAKKPGEALQGDTEVLKVEKKQPERDCLKCDTFAELQERLGCIDGSELTMDVLKSSLKGASLDNILTKPHLKKEASDAPQTVLNPGIGCNQAAPGGKQTDGAIPGDSFQREDSGLYDCEECGTTSSSEELLNQTLGRNMTLRSALPNTTPAKLGDELSSKGFDTNARNMAATSSPALHPQGKQEGHETWFKPDKRASPIGKSSPISPSSSCSSSHSLAKSVIFGDMLSNRTSEDNKEMKATITVTVQQPLDLKGQDELVFSMVEEVTISGAYDRGNAGGNIICIRDPVQSQAQDQSLNSSQPIRIISNVSDDSAVAGTPVAKTTNNEMHQYPISRREKYILPSFINPMLIDTDVECDLDCTKVKENSQETPEGVNTGSELKISNVKYSEGNIILEKRTGTFTSEEHKTHKKSDKACCPPCCQSSSDQVVLEDSIFEERPQNTDKLPLRDHEHVYSTNNGKVSVGENIASRHSGNVPKRTGVIPGCQETILDISIAGSLPQAWQNARFQDNHSRGVTSSTPCSPGGTLQRGQGRQHSSKNYSLLVSSPEKSGREFKQDLCGTLRNGDGTVFDTSSLTRKIDKTSSRLKSPAEDSSRLFSTKLEQLAARTNSLGRSPRGFPTLERGSSNISTSSRGSSRESSRRGYKVGSKGGYEGDATFPRASRSPKKNPRSDQSHHYFHSENLAPQTAKHTHSKLSAVGKLKMVSPKIRRLSAPSIKNMGPSHKNLQHPVNRSASLSPDSKTVNFERTSSFFSSSPPQSHHSISRTPSQSSTCSSTKSAIQGFVNGRISEISKEKACSPTMAGLDQLTTLPSPYSHVTAPRMPDHQSGHASDTTSVLSGDLPPAMGKTSLHFSNRNSLVSSGYDSMVRDSEATSNRESLSDRSGSLLSVARSSRSSRRRGNTGTHPRRLSHDTAPSLKRPAGGLRSRWMDRGIPEAYEIKVYEIDNVQRMQKRAGAGKQGPTYFSAKLKFLEQRQQRISEVRVKYNNLRRELEQSKHNLMLEPEKWNQEFDVWQTFEVDPLEHLEALEEVTTRLGNRVSLCKASIMMVTCFDASTRRRRKKRWRKAPQQRTLKGF